jgi:uncharacterized glyoxalase superfamily metalloenzyme YdcJ
MFVHPSDIRTLLSRKKSAIYRTEVPLFQDLLEMIGSINANVEQEQPGTLERIGLTKERLTEEIHGAIRLALPYELQKMAEGFAICGMYPANYYDLTVAGMPSHATAFRPLEREELAKNPYRVFTSMLKLDVLKEKMEAKIKQATQDPRIAAERSAELWSKIESILAKRTIFTPRYLELLDIHKQQEGFTNEQAQEFVDAFLETFKWQRTAAVSKELYEELSSLYKIVGDVLGFRVPHINHLTPVTLDIDRAHQAMKERGMKAIKVIQGPPARLAPVLLRQTSFRALTEETSFPDENGRLIPGGHTARFGEIEQRGVAVTPKGRALYDLLLDAVIQAAPAEEASHYTERYPQVLASIFELYPDSYEVLRKQKLAYFYYHPTEEGRKASQSQALTSTSTEDLIREGYLQTVPITYEDFLPVSAVGIFKSNLGDMDSQQGGDYSDVQIQSIKEKLNQEILELYNQYDENGNPVKEAPISENQRSFEQALGQAPSNMFHAYAALQDASINNALKELNVQEQIVA